MTVPPPCFGLYAERYARYRPTYPAALYERLLSRLAGPREHAVDLGAGNGQVAGDLLAYFEQVTAVEPDAEMAALIPKRDRLAVINARAEDADFPDASVDAVLVGTAFHWMDQGVVCAHVRRWLRPGGVLFVFAYDRFRTPSAPVQAVLDAEAALWTPHKHEKLAQLNAYPELIAATGLFDRVEATSLEAEWGASPEALAGFLMTASFATAHAKSTGDADAYAVDFAARLAEAAGGDFIPMRYVVDGALART